MAGACGRSNRSQSKAMIFALGVSRVKSNDYRSSFIIIIESLMRKIIFFHGIKPNQEQN